MGKTEINIRTKSKEYPPNMKKTINELIHSLHVPLPKNVPLTKSYEQR